MRISGSHQYFGHTVRIFTSWCSHSSLASRHYSVGCALAINTQRWLFLTFLDFILICFVSFRSVILILIDASSLFISIPCNATLKMRNREWHFFRTKFQYVDSVVLQLSVQKAIAYFKVMTWIWKNSSKFKTEKNLIKSASHRFIWVLIQVSILSAVSYGSFHFARLKFISYKRTDTMYLLDIRWKNRNQRFYSWKVCKRIRELKQKQTRNCNFVKEFPWFW